jgi:hypothetical protein
MTVIHPEPHPAACQTLRVNARELRRSLPAHEIHRPRPIGVLRALAVSRPLLRGSYAQKLKVSRANLMRAKAKVS